MSSFALLNIYDTQISETLTEVRKTLKLTPHEEEVLQEAFGKGFSFSDEKLPPTAEHAWDFISTLYFSITSTTTIGNKEFTEYEKLFIVHLKKWRVANSILIVIQVAIHEGRKI